MKNFLKYLLLALFLNLVLIGSAYLWLISSGQNVKGDLTECAIEDQNQAQETALTGKKEGEKPGNVAVTADQGNFSSKKISVLSFGDLMLGRLVGQKIQDGLDPFGEMRRYSFPGSVSWDFMVANLEGPISGPRDCVDKAYSFRFEPSVVEMISEAGFNVLNMANNHAFDCYEAGFEETKDRLDSAGIFYFGDPKAPTFAQLDDVIFIGLDFTVDDDLSLEKYEDFIRTGKESEKIVVVNVHWGVEYAKKANQRQTEIAHRLVDMGADLIIGHHPHVIQNMEVYHKVPIFYSLGNFIFDQVGVDENIGLGVGVVFRNDVTAINLYPFEIINHTPTFYDSQKADDFCEKYFNQLEEAETFRFQKTGCSLNISD